MIRRLISIILIVAFFVGIGSFAAFPEAMHRPARFFYNDVYRVALPETHRFPMEKYRMVREGLQRAFVGDARVDFEVSPLATAEELKSTHCSRYVDRYLRGQMSELEIRRVGFPWSISGVQRSTSSVGGTVAAMRAVCSGEAAFAGHIAGGTHHAFYDYGEGFCVFSDIAVAANLALYEFPSIQKILIVDLDVHQGDTTKS
jgi:acetoin utilization deacetylase AcuC-like enzyme